MTPEEYDGWYDTPRGRWIGDVEFQLLCTHLDTNPGTSLLDVGCGTGWFTRRLSAIGLEVTGIDVDGAALDFASRRSGSDVRRPSPPVCRPIFRSGGVDHGAVLRRQLARRHCGDRSRMPAPLRAGAAESAQPTVAYKGGGTRGYQGAHWHTPTELAGVLEELRVEHIHLSTAILSIWIAAGTCAGACSAEEPALGRVPCNQWRYRAELPCRLSVKAIVVPALDAASARQSAQERARAVHGARAGRRAPPDCRARLLVARPRKHRSTPRSSPKRYLRCPSRHDFMASVKKRPARIVRLTQERTSSQAFPSVPELSFQGGLTRYADRG